MTERILVIRDYDDEPSKQPSLHVGNKSAFHEYILHLQGSTVNKITHVPSNRRRRFLQAPLRVLQELFLPIGYPMSVREGYLQYQLYDSLQGLCSYLRGVLCSAQVLQAAGVGKAEATALGAALTWALKDGMSMMGGLTFSYFCAPLFDSHVKEFRLFADIINDVGLFLDMMAPYFENNLLLVSSLAGLCKSLCGLSAGATKSSITHYFALEGNMADLNAKESTQETLVSLIGMMLGVSLAHSLQRLQQQQYNSNRDAQVVQLQWWIFSILTVIHVWANWKGVSILRMRTLNRERTEVALTSVLEALVKLSNQTDSVPLEDHSSTIDVLASAVAAIPTPMQVQESLVASTYKMIIPGRLCLSAPLARVLALNGITSAMTESFTHEHYILAVEHRFRKVWVSLLVGAGVSDQLKAFLHALLLVKLLGRRRQRLVKETQALVMTTHELISRLFPQQSKDSEKEGSIALMKVLFEQGWDVQERVYVGFSRRRSQMTEEKTE